MPHEEGGSEMTTFIRTFNEMEANSVTKFSYTELWSVEFIKTKRLFWQLNKTKSCCQVCRDEWQIKLMAMSNIHRVLFSNKINGKAVKSIYAKCMRLLLSMNTFTSFYSQDKTMSRTARWVGLFISGKTKQIFMCPYYYHLPTIRSYHLMILYHFCGSGI